MPSFSHQVGLSIGQPIGENLDGTALAARWIYTFNGTNNYINTAFMRVDIGDLVTFKIFTDANPATSSTIFDGQSSLIKLVAGTGGALNATGGTISPATLDTSGELTTYTFTATAAGSITVVGANVDGLANFAVFPILDVFVNGVGLPIDDGWQIDPLLRGNVFNTGASNGATNYDRYTEIYINYETDVDPKYGDVAPNLAEAEARADEGIMVNGDFRDGTIAGWIARLGATLSYDSGAMKIETSTSGGAYRDVTVIANTPYQVSATSEENVAEGRLYIYDGANFTNALLNSFNRLLGTKTFIVTPTTTTMRLYLGNTGSAGSVNYTDLEVNTATTETVSGPTVGNGTANNFVEANWSRLGSAAGTPFIDGEPWNDGDPWND